MKPKSDSSDCRCLYFVDGEHLLRVMTDAEMDEAELAQKAKVSEQTIRNYLHSTRTTPWSANSKSFRRVCEALGKEASELQIEMVSPSTPNQDRAILSDKRFLGDSDTVRSIAGKWHAESLDLEIPGVIALDGAKHWSGDVLIEQFGNQFEAHGEDKDGDGVFASGVLMEVGNWLRLNYWIENPQLRLWGTAVVEYKGCGRLMEGVFVGRDSGQSDIGMVVAKVTLTRVDI